MPGTPPPDTVLGVLDAARSLAAVDWEAAEPRDLPAIADGLARVRALTDAALVAVADRLEDTDAAATQGWASTKDFLTHLLGGHKGAGGSYTRAAARTRALPQVRSAMATGDLSMAQARVIADRTTTLPEVLDLRPRAADLMLAQVEAHALDATDLDRTFPSVVRELDPDGSLLRQDLEKDRAERSAHHARHLSFSRDAVGGIKVRGYGTPEDVELIKTTLMPLAGPVTTEPGACGGDAHLPGQTNRDREGRRIRRGCPDPTCSHDGRDPREAGARLWDALVEGCRRLQSTDVLPHDHGSTPRVVVTISYDDLRRQVSGEGLLGSGEALSAAAVRRLACDADLVPGVLGSRGEILDVGRARRLVTAAIWLSLVLRDRHCSFPGCTRPPIACDAHHITHWADGGPTALDNLTLLCRRHHTLAHSTPWTVALDPQTRRPVWHPPPPVDDRDRFTYLPAQRPPLIA